MMTKNGRLRHAMAAAIVWGSLGTLGCALESYGDDELEDDRADPSAVAAYSTGDEPLRIVTFNVGGAGDSKSEYEALRGELLDTDRILVLQEVQDISGMRSALSEDFPYEYITENYTDKKWDTGCLCRKRKRNNVVVLSRLPIVHQESSLIQTDPGGDKWRRHAQHVRIKVRDDMNISLFHYHNTYNWHENSSQSERSGMESFKDWVESRVGSLSSSSDKVFMAGDFNLEEDAAKAILGASLTYQSEWVDHVVSTNISKADGGVIDGSSISDHDVVWAQFDLTSNVITAENNVVRLYEHSDFNGQVTAFEQGDDPNIGTSRGEWWNDRISSIISGSRVKLHAWEHSNYGGTKWCLPAQDDCGTSNFNDKITALKVLPR
ncbi:MAG: endonuclease/exonuclease/phosphatase family protein [Myxococcota bacterium]